MPPEQAGAPTRQEGALSPWLQASAVTARTDKGHLSEHLHQASVLWPVHGPWQGAELAPWLALGQPPSPQRQEASGGEGGAARRRRLSLGRGAGG